MDRRTASRPQTLIGHWILSRYNEKRPNSWLVRTLIGFSIGIVAVTLSGCLPLMAASAAGTVVYYNMPHHK